MPFIIHPKAAVNTDSMNFIQELYVFLGVPVRKKH